MNRTTAFQLLIFFVCLNLACYVINETQVLGDPEQTGEYLEGTETPESITAITYSPLLSSIWVLIGGLAITAMLRQYLFGTTLTIIIFGLSLLYEPVTWVVSGFPTFLAQIGVHEIFWTVGSVLFSLVFFWFLIGIATQRHME